MERPKGVVKTFSLRRSPSLGEHVGRFECSFFSAACWEEVCVVGDSEILTIGLLAASSPPST
jgi:hypothetical protein